MTPLDPDTIRQILNDTDPARTEALARQAAALTRQYFGRARSLYTPLYLSNYCSGRCVYCGFNHQQPIARIKLCADEIRQEAQTIAQMGIEDILLLTGESYTATPLSYLIEAVDICKPFFPSIGLEIHALEEDEYRSLFLAGVDSVTLYQETYDRARYQEVHLAGRKKDYDFRYHAPERIAAAGVRRISMGVLLGLSDPAQDLYALFTHLRRMERMFPGVEYSLSFPRLRGVPDQHFQAIPISDAQLIKILCLARIFFPRTGINLSTRESGRLRNHALHIAATRLSAASRTSVGGYAADETSQRHSQFQVVDHRGVDDVVRFLKDHQFDPVLTDWRRIPNG